ncbi:hypothetical protein EG329_011082 [Mollisiaceae sp. DMI_Dod_QoI]|nr:hypothetical protein EG329_011082 [Helotiales sp. DMI_Dod_QoI]
MSDPAASDVPVVRRSIFTFAEKCPSFANKPNCDVQLNSSNQVVTFGGFEKGQLPAQPDIAGEGVIAGFAILTIFIFVISLFLIFLNIVDLFHPRYIQSIRNRVAARTAPGNGFRRHASVRAVILAIIDLQMVFTVAYGLNFASDGVCSASVYHYYVFVNVVLMSCASSILAIIVLPNYWKTPMSAVVRLAATAAVFFFALQLVIKQQQGLNHLPEKYPDNNSQDSFLLLPAMCFLDTSFDVTVNNVKVNNAAVNAGSNAGSNVAALRLSDNAPLQFEFYFFVILSGCFTFGFLGQAIFCCVRRREDKGTRNGRSRFFKKIFSFLWLVSWVLSFAVAIWCLVYVVRVRNWVGDSDWIKPGLDTKNPESEIVGLAQLLSLWALVLILVAVLDHLWVIGSSQAAIAPQPRLSPSSKKPLKMRGKGSGGKRFKSRPFMG